MNAYLRRLAAATLPVVSALALFAGAAPAHADLTPPPTGDSAYELCLRNGGTPERCAQLLNPSTGPVLNPSSTQIRRIATVRLNTVTTSPSGSLATSAPLLRTR